MGDFVKCNYISGFYTSTDKIENFKFKVTIKEVNKNVLLTRSDLASEDLCEDLEAENVGYCEERAFSWQEKVVASESNVQNRDEEASENAESVHEDENKNKICNKLISYIDNDGYENKNNLTTDPKEGLNRRREVKSVSITKSTEENKNSSEGDGDQINNNQKMFIVALMSNNERTRKTLQDDSEKLLLSLIWQPDEKCLTVSPDFNDIKTNPYIFERHHDSKKLFHYSIEQIADRTDDAKLTEIDFLQKISQYENECRTRKLFHTFPMPPKNILKCAVIIEILSASMFEYDNLYVEYTVEIPDGYKCRDGLKGATQISKTEGPERTANFGHLFELSIDYFTDDIKDGGPLRSPRIYFEIISRDAWERHRTEGYCHIRIPIDEPGSKRTELNAFNPRSVNKILWNMNRYFIGGCHPLKDIAVVGVPDAAQGECSVKCGMTCVSTGKLNVSTNVILQSSAFARGSSEGGERRVSEKLNADSLFKSVNAALSAYNEARQKFEASLRSASNDNFDGRNDGDKTLSER